MISIVALVCCLLPASALAQEESFKIYAEHPRIFLRPHHLKLLQKEKQRQSMRWEQFHSLMTGNAPMPEPGFAKALYYRVAGDQDAGREAVAWALGPGTDLRQLALVFDWCQDLLTDAQSKALATRLERGIASLEGDSSVPAVRSRMLAAVALGGHRPEVSTSEIRRLINGWWQGKIVPGLKTGRPVLRLDDNYALFEILHIVRDNLNVDLREAAPKFFKQLPGRDLLSYYPATYSGPDGEYRIPAMDQPEEPDLHRAALSRAAELSMVTYDTNATENLYVQGWLMHDRFLLRSPFGAPYEFLWANPYIPGLSYERFPPTFHDKQVGQLFIRSNWEESATWLGCFDGHLQLFRDGKITVLDPRTAGPVDLTTALVLPAAGTRRFKIRRSPNEEVFVVGLEPSCKYDLEVDHEEMREVHTDRSGILSLDLPENVEVGLRLRAVTDSHR